MEKIKKDQKFLYFIAYSLSFIAYGFSITGLGPLIPYLAANQHILETQYSFLFSCRAGGFLLFGILMKQIQKYMSLHCILICSSLMCGVTFTIFSFVESTTSQGLVVFVASMASCGLQISVNSGMLISHIGKYQQFWLQLLHGVFGIGGFIGPILVYIFQTHSFMVMGILVALISPFYFYLRSPQNKQSLIKMHVLDDQKQRQKQESDLTAIPHSTQYFLYILFFLYLGLQAGQGGWISSYAVIQKVSAKQAATSYSSLFWISMTIFRFAFAFVPGKVSFKLKLCALGSFGSAFLSSIFAMLGFYYLATVSSSILLGIFFAAIFALLLALPNEYGLQIKVYQSANIFIFVAFGEGILSMMVGYLMKIFNPNMIFYSLTVFSIAFLIIIEFMLKDLQQTSIKRKGSSMGSQLESKLIDSKNIEMKAILK